MAAKQGKVSAGLLGKIGRHTIGKHKMAARAERTRRARRRGQRGR